MLTVILSNGKVAFHGANLLLVSGSIGGISLNTGSVTGLFVYGFVKPTTGRVLINGMAIRLVQKVAWWLTFLNQSEVTGISP